MTLVDPVACGVFLLVAFVLAGTVQTAWFASPASHQFAQPLDAGLTLRGRPLFGRNKTLRGVVVMVPASAGAFALLALFSGDPAALGLWPLSVFGYLLAGAVAGFGFMAGELPNSFVKRQLDIAPGDAPRTALAAACHFALDRLDSGIGMLLALNLFVAVPWRTVAVVLIAGPFLHWTFSVVMFRLGLKPRPA
ncbi:MAG TPA: CDP-archaeol synthase [Vicinamibacterales bacterium]|nr:CDP-archaeol synthase [Vicinamibacterales bacterium]